MDNEILRRVKEGKMLYASFSAGTIMAGMSTSINRDAELPAHGWFSYAEELPGFQLVPCFLRPHFGQNVENHIRVTNDFCKWRYPQVKCRNKRCPIILVKDRTAVSWGNTVFVSPTKSTKSPRLNSQLSLGEPTMGLKFEA